MQADLFLSLKFGNLNVCMHVSRRHLYFVILLQDQVLLKYSASENLTFLCDSWKHPHDFRCQPVRKTMILLTRE